MASQKLTGRAASLERRRLQTAGKGSGSQAAPRPATRREPEPAAPRATAPAPSVAPRPAASARPAPVKVQPQSAARSASLARRAALSARGKAGVRGGDRQRTADMVRTRTNVEGSKPKGECGCGGECCKGKAADAPKQGAPVLKPPVAGNGKLAKKQRPVNLPTSRLVSRARRAAMSSKGKAGVEAHRKGISTASLARQANPDISGRELARAVRERRSRNGAQGTSGSPQARRQRQRSGSGSGEGRPVSGTKVGHSGKLTGDEPGLCHSGITGTEYFAAEIFEEFCRDQPPKVPAKVTQTETARGSRVTTGGRVGSGANLTGTERGNCHNVTGSEYLGREHFAEVCDTRPEPGSAKVSQSRTQRGTVISGPRPSRSEKVSGNERGTCKAVTGTPYAGFEEVQAFCPPEQREESRRRMPQRSMGAGRAISGIQPGLGVDGMTGAEAGACQSVSGTPYLAMEEVKEVCTAAPAEPGEPDFPQPLAAVSTAAPAPSAPPAPPRRSVTGSGYEGPGSVTGAFSMGRGKVTGTEQFRFGDRAGNVISVEPQEEAQVNARVTGEGLDTGLRITGDDWDRGDRVTGTEGSSAARRNPTRRGPTSAMPQPEARREPQRERPSANVTGGSGGSQGAAVTVSGGARG